jgi:hypothetical protein
MKKSLDWLIRQTKPGYLCGSSPDCIRLSAQNQGNYHQGVLQQLDPWRGIPVIGFRCGPLKWWSCTLVEKSVRSEMEDIPMPRLSPAVELGTIEQNLMTLGFPAQTIRLFPRHSGFPMFEFRTHQICFLNHETLNRTIHLSELSTLFDVTERTVRRALAWRPEGPLLLGPIMP